MLKQFYKTGFSMSSFRSISVDFYCIYTKFLKIKGQLPSEEHIFSICRTINADGNEGNYMNFYKSKDGESLYEIAISLDMPVECLVEANSNIRNVKKDLMGSIVLVPDRTVVEGAKEKKVPKYIVECPQPISQIAGELGITESSIVELNPCLADSVLVEDGTVITLPNTKLFGNVICSISDRNGAPEIFCFYPDGRKPLNTNICNVGWNSNPTMSPDKTKVCFQDVEGQFKVVMLDRIEEEIIAKRSQPGVYGFWSMSSDKVLFESFGDVFVYDFFERECRRLDRGTNAQWLGDSFNVVYLQQGMVIKYDILTDEKSEIKVNEGEKYGLRTTYDGSMISYFTRTSYTNGREATPMTLKMVNVYSQEIFEVSNFGNTWTETGAWSYDSRYFSFWSPGQVTPNGVLGMLKILNRECQSVYDVPAITDPKFARTAWSPDSDGLCFSARSSGGCGQLNLFGVSLTGESAQITGTGNCVSPDWR